MIIDNTQFSEDTLFKVYEALKNQGFDFDQSTRVVCALLNAGILFRERIPSENIVDICE